jgi:hypothetical protein
VLPFHKWFILTPGNAGGSQDGIDMVKMAYVLGTEALPFGYPATLLGREYEETYFGTYLEALDSMGLEGFYYYVIILRNLI